MEAYTIVRKKEECPTKKIIPILKCSRNYKLIISGVEMEVYLSPEKVGKDTFYGLRLRRYGQKTSVTMW